MNTTGPRLEVTPPQGRPLAKADSLLLYGFFALLVIGLIVVAVSLGRL